MGRPSKLTPGVRAKVVEAVAGGAFFATACELAGISEATGYRWLERGETGESPYREFREAVKRAEAQAEADAIATVRQAAQGGTWQAAAWYLERKYPDRWGKRAPLPVSPPDDEQQPGLMIVPADDPQWADLVPRPEMASSS